MCCYLQVYKEFIHISVRTHTGCQESISIAMIVLLLVGLCLAFTVFPSYSVGNSIIYAMNAGFYYIPTNKGWDFMSISKLFMTKFTE